MLLAQGHKGSLSGRSDFQDWKQGQQHTDFPFWGTEFQA